MIATAKRILLTAALALTALLATQTASAQTYTCIIVNGCKVLIIYDPCGNVLSIQTDCGSNGSGTFNAITPVPAAGPLNVSLAPVNINATVQDPTYGTVNTTFDASREAAPTTITSNDQASRFPATGLIRFYANATVASAPGTRYASRTQLVFKNNNLNSFDPFVNEQFTLAEDVEFYSVGDLSQSTVFTLQAGASTVTLGGAPSQQGPGGVR